MEFIKENVNPKGWKCGDCVVRACSSATGLSWDEVYQALCDIGFKKKRMPNDECCYSKFLTDHGFVRMGQMRNEYGDKMSVAELAEYYEDPEHILVVHTKNHLTCVRFGDIIDAWDTSRQTAGYYFLGRM